MQTGSASTAIGCIDPTSAHRILDRSLAVHDMCSVCCYFTLADTTFTSGLTTRQYHCLPHTQALQNLHTGLSCSSQVVNMFRICYVKSNKLLPTCNMLMSVSIQEFLISPTQLGIPYSRPRYFAVMKHSTIHSTTPFPLQAGNCCSKLYGCEDGHDNIPRTSPPPLPDLASSNDSTVME